MSDSSPLRELNLAEPATAEHDLLACCASRRWADELLARRPYSDLATLRRMSATVVDRLEWADLEEAMAAHPRLGERAAGDGREAAWSRDEQAGAAASPASAELAKGNAAYEERFGHVFLVCATGLSGEDVLAALRARLDNDEETERGIVRDELRKIVDLRLGKAFS